MFNILKKPEKPKPLKIHIGKTNGVCVDPDEFFAQPKVIKRMEQIKKMDIEGKILGPAKRRANNASSGESD